MAALTYARILNVRGQRADVVDLSPRTADQFCKEPGPKALLIHGFANSPQEAQVSYRAMERHIDKILAPHALSDFRSVWDFHWPGNHPGGAAMDPPSYSTRIAAADDAGARLGGLLNELPAPQDVMIIAHSLGCQVAMSAVRQLISLDLKEGDLRAEPKLTVFLMAAAVGTDDCEPVPTEARGQDESTWDRYDRFNADPRFSWRRPNTFYAVGHSKRDWVLKQTFPPGQAIAGRARKAVGLYGGPMPGMADRDRWDERLKTGLRHGQYWTSEEVAAWIAGELPCGHGRRVLGTWPIFPEEHELAEHYLPAHELAGRPL